MCLHMGISMFVQKPLEVREVNFSGAIVTEDWKSPDVQFGSSVEDKAVDQPAGVGTLNMTPNSMLRSSFCVWQSAAHFGGMPKESPGHLNTTLSLCRPWAKPILIVSFLCLLKSSWSEHFTSYILPR